MFKTWKNVSRGFKAQGVFSYFNEIESILKTKSNAKSADDYLCLNNLEQALAVRAAYKIKYTMDKLNHSQTSENEKINSLYAVDIV